MRRHDIVIEPIMLASPTASKNDGSQTTKCKGGNMAAAVFAVASAAFAALICALVRWLAQGDVGAGADVSLSAVARVKCFAGDDSVNF